MQDQRLPVALGGAIRQHAEGTPGDLVVPRDVAEPPRGPQALQLVGSDARLVVAAVAAHLADVLGVLVAHVSSAGMTRSAIS